ncbi:hypothetical protein F5148DRAFT_1299440 [Russula earlei]|uniref:Uncharacterized protein n=1 Tax=Russula earlei TaxID=71964 RepID=A0ACC0U9G8_9AGAM|nr:hypothetical protein F5148DRAFT_1299440 [Russula earlei]
MMTIMIDSNIPDLKLLSKGKHLLFVTSDRISAYDVVLKNGIPDKCRVLTELSLFWFDKLRSVITNHVVTSHQHREQLVRKPLAPFTASRCPTASWNREKLPAPLFTPSTKAEQGAHDENVSPERAAALIGQDLYDRISALAAEHAATRGLIIADTKFELGLDIDEALTPDSSRYLLAAGRPSFDKQHLRDWLRLSGLPKEKGLRRRPRTDRAGR